MTAVRRALIGAGALLAAYAVGGALTDRDVKAGVLLFLVAVLVANDGVLLPAVMVVGAVLGRILPRRGRGYVQGALIVALSLTVVAYPLVLARGRAADNPSLLPLDYGRGLLEAYAGIVVAAIAVAGLRAWRGGRTRKQTERSAEPAGE